MTEAGERLNEQGFAELRDMNSSPEYLEALARSELHPLDPAQAPIA